MIKKAKNIFNASIVFSILLAILGLVMIINPGTTLDVMCKIFAVIIILKGLFLVVMNFKDSNVYLPFEPLVPGIISIIIGIVLFMNPDYFETVTALLVGIWIILESINDVSISWKLRKTDAPWLITFCLSVISLLAGIILLFNPHESAEVLLMWSGIILFINSLISVIDKFIFKKYVKELKKTTKEIIKAIEE